LIFVYKIGSAPHVNSFSLGETGRYRTNVWDYPGVNVPGDASREALSMHPTVKPVAMVEDAIKDCSARGHRILDPFAGSGTTLIAAEACGRIAHVMELDPAYCDTILERVSKVAGIDAVHRDTGKTWSAARLARIAGKESA